MTPDRLPPALRLVLDEELAAGKEIIDAGCTFPAPQVLERIAAHLRFREGITNFRIDRNMDNHPGAGAATRA